MNKISITLADQRLINETIDKYVAIAEKFFKKKLAPITKIEYIVKLGKTAGYCSTKFADKTSALKFNPVLFNENKEDFLKRTVPHEVAHHAVYNIFGFKQGGKRVMPHGQHFKYIMSAVFGVEDVTTYHSYDTSTAAKMVRTRIVARPYQYKCGCHTHTVTKNIHTKMKRGQIRRCSGCKMTLKYVGIKGEK